MSNIIYLYLKTHNKTGLKYLGKTVRDPYTYHGSGKYWLDHISKHGLDITTEVLFQTEDELLFRKKALQYSKKFNIVESNEFANLCHEEGQGGATFLGQHHSEETKKKLSKKLIGYKFSKERNKKISESHKNKNLSDYHREKIKASLNNEETKIKLSNSTKGTKWWNNGFIMKRSKESPGIDWILGKLK